MQDYEIKELERKQALRLKVEKATKDLIDSLNIMGREKEVTEAFTNAVCTSHRTLQANLVRLIRGFLNQYKDKPSDLRNQGAVEFARIAIEAGQVTPIPFI